MRDAELQCAKATVNAVHLADEVTALQRHVSQVHELRHHADYSREQLRHVVRRLFRLVDRLPPADPLRAAPVFVPDRFLVRQASDTHRSRGSARTRACRCTCTRIRSGAARRPGPSFEKSALPRTSGSSVCCRAGMKRACTLHETTPYALASNTPSAPASVFGDEAYRHDFVTSCGHAPSAMYCSLAKLTLCTGSSNSTPWARRRRRSAARHFVVRRCITCH